MSRTVILYDIDSKIPNLALMKISSFYKKKGFLVILSKEIKYIEADRYYASTIFNCNKSKEKAAELYRLYGGDIDIGGSGIDLTKCLTSEMESCFPDYQLYDHSKYALGFLTRGCHKKCPFCLVPIKEGALRKAAASTDDFVPPGQSHVMLLDDNLLSYSESSSLLSEMLRREYAVNFSQSLDITYLNDENFKLLNAIDSRNARFTKRMFYFSCNHTSTIDEFSVEKD
jgi:hypothetical protein